jgi:hypothetical protein
MRRVCKPAAIHCHPAFSAALEATRCYMQQHAFSSEQSTLTAAAAAAALLRLNNNQSHS